MDSGFLFGALLVGLTAGTVLYLFLIVLVLGHRHKTPVERLLLFVFVAMFLHQSGLLLYLNTLLEPLEHDGAAKFALCLAYVGLVFLPALLVHLHVKYLNPLQGMKLSAWMAATTVLYCAIPFQLLGLEQIWRSGDPRMTPALIPDKPLALAFLSVAGIHGIAAKRETEASSRTLHVLFCGFFVFAATGLVFLAATGRFDWRNDPPATFLMISPALPGALMIYLILRRSFAQLSVQRNLAFAAAGGFLAVLYLTLATRVSLWLAPYFPRVATVSILVFVLVFLFEPLQRWLSRALKRLFRVEVEKVQRLMAEIRQHAYRGDVGELLLFAETRIRDEFEMADAAIDVPGRRRELPSRSISFPLVRAHAELQGSTAHSADEALVVSHAGPMLSGETQATLETLALQLPAAIDLCRAIEAKLTLERELAERERFAMLGQMAASISHNLKNPLGSMKTLLQLQLENPNLPAEMRKDCELVVAEIDRMGAKLQQLLHYARPAVRSRAQSPPLDASTLVAQILDLIRKDASQRGIALLFEKPPGDVLVAAPQEALTDIFQNVIVNAVEATGRRGTVKVSLAKNGEGVMFAVTDDGSGIPADVQARIFQPFFTTKPSGTGLGLAIVQRRLAEIGGTIECTSPAANDRGTRFVVMLG